MTAYLIVGIATSYWVVRKSSGHAEVVTAEALVIILIWPALLADLVIGKK
jgi:hypothetical protein